MKVVINNCYGGFGLSDKAYEKLIEWGIPVKKYIREKRDDDEEVIFDRTLNENDDLLLLERYWETWLHENREHPLLVRAVEELGDEASGRYSKLVVIDIPDDIEYEISEYDGIEHIAEKHRTWC